VRVYLGSDHAGFELKAAIIAWLGEAGHEAVDCGPARYDPQDDYPVYVLRAAQGTIRDPGSLGIVIGGSGNGEQIAANKVPGIRAALAWTLDTARLAREHNDANVLSLGAREYSTEDGVSFAKVFVETPFSGEPRHARRLAMIADFEKTAELPPLLSPGGTTPRTPAVSAPGPDRKNRDRIRPARADEELRLPRGREPSGAASGPGAVAAWSASAPLGWASRAGAPAKAQASA
jgi:ribose 5-phosphate isomerase B